MTKALEKQIGGQHYKGMGMQPAVFAMRNNLDACAFSILKYVSRHHNKDGVEGVNKARHFVEIRLELFEDVVGKYYNPRIWMSEYIGLNNLTGPTAGALLKLEDWLMNPTISASEPLLAAIDQILRDEYGFPGKDDLPLV